MKTALLVVCSLSGAAFAGERTVTLDRACVEVDAGDVLAPADREHSARVLRQVLESEHQLVVDSECTETYRLSHERSEERYVIRVHSGAGKRRMTVPALDELPVRYRKLVRSLLEAKQLAATERAATERAAAAAAPDTPTASPIPTISPAEMATLDGPSFEPAMVPHALQAPGIDESIAESVTPSVEKRSLFYFLFGGRMTGGTGGSFGYRRHLETVTLDFALSWLSPGDSMEHTNGASVVTELLKYSSVASYSRVYAGGGLSMGTREMWNNDHVDPHFEGGGVHAEATAGLQIGRARGPKLMVQMDLTLPFYRLGNWQGDKVYAPSFLMTIGVGY